MSEKPLNEYIDMEVYDVVSGETYRKLLARSARLEEALTITLEMLDGLAEQQAMPDDWWKPNAERARAALDTKEKA